jgi:hypothetical protein
MIAHQICSYTLDRLYFTKWDGSLSTQKSSSLLLAVTAYLFLNVHRVAVLNPGTTALHKSYPRPRYVIPSLALDFTLASPSLDPCPLASAEREPPKG